MAKSMGMRPPLSITTLIGPTFAICADKARFGRNPWAERKVWTEISADTIINGFVKAGITEKTTTIEVGAKDESVLEDIASDTETFPYELMYMIDGNGFSSESDLLDN